MKTLITILFTAIMAQAQSGISFGVYQDIKLGLGMDKEHGNDKPTADLIFNMNWEGKQLNGYYFTIQTQYEHANLSGGYFKRYSVNGLWNFNSLERITISTGVGIGAIHRSNNGVFSYSGVLEARYRVLNNLDLALKNEFVKRNDLPNKKLGYNLAFGVVIKAFKINGRS